MFEESHPWLHVMIFIALTLVSLIWMVIVRPYDETLVNVLRISNEFFCLLIASLILPLQDFKYNYQQLNEMALIPLYCIYACAVLDILTGIVYNLQSLFQKVK